MRTENEIFDQIVALEKILSDAQLRGYTDIANQTKAQLYVLHWLIGTPLADYQKLYE